MTKIIFEKKKKKHRRKKEKKDMKSQMDQNQNKVSK